MLKHVVIALTMLSFNVSLAAAYCSKEETLKLVEAGYSKHEIDRLCKERHRSPEHRENRDLRGKWRGFYSYQRQNRRPDVPFHLVVVHQDRHAFSGYIKEPQTFGTRLSDSLSAEVNGRINRDNQVEFVKRYTGKGGVHHKVIYKGELRRGEIKGHWFIPGQGSGSFAIKREL